MIFFCRTRIFVFKNLVFISVFCLFSFVSLQSFSVKLSKLACFGMYCLINFYAFTIVPFCYAAYLPAKNNSSETFEYYK